MTNGVECVDLLMEFGANLDIGDAHEDWTARGMYLSCGPQITAVVSKWLRKRNGEEAPMDEKKCLECGKKDVSLKLCGKCCSAKYCSSECQRLLSHVSIHSE